MVPAGALPNHIRPSANSWLESDGVRSYFVPASDYAKSDVKPSWWRRLFVVFALAAMPLFAEEAPKPPAPPVDACICYAVAIRVVDGDTVVLRVQSPSYCKDGAPFDNVLAYNAPVKVRLLAVDTPEKGEKDFYKAKDYTAKWLHRNKVFAVIFTATGDAPTYDKFGRLLAAIMPAAPEKVNAESSLNRALLDVGLAKPMPIKHNRLLNGLTALILKPGEKK
jgi:endonuclease YncB( thermonuclease family)